MAGRAPRQQLAATVVQVVVAWATVTLFLLFGLGHVGTAASATPAVAAVLFLWLLAVILWCAFGVVHHAETLADVLGEPLGTLVLTLSAITIEVALLTAVMLEGEADPTLGRDTIFAVLMIVLNGLVGLALLIGGLRHREQSFNLQGARAFLAVIVPLSTIGLIMPTYTTSTATPTLSAVQAVCFAVFTVLLYGVFLGIQTVRHRPFFVQEAAPAAAVDAGAGSIHDRQPGRGILAKSALLVTILLPVVLLAEEIGGFIDYGIHSLGAPTAFGGLLIASLILAPEGLGALRAALANRLQRAVNLALGTALSTMGLTIPAVLAIGLATDEPVLIGLEAEHIVLLAVTLVSCVLTFGGGQTNVLQGAVHLVLFFVYVVLIFSP